MSNTKIITREKHLDHMVKVVPLIVSAYAIQCYFISSMSEAGFAIDGVIFLGACLIMMIVAFVTYDLTHIVKVEEEGISISVGWLGHHKFISYQDLSSIQVSEPGQTFATLKITTLSGKKFRFYFVDEADKLKECLEQKRFQEFKQAA